MQRLTLPTCGNSKANLLTKAIENDGYASFANPLGEIFQESSILVPIATGQAAAYPVREPDRLQFGQLCDLIDRFAESLKTRCGGISTQRWFPRFELAINIDNVAPVTLRITVNRDRTEKRGVNPAFGAIRVNISPRKGFENGARQPGAAPRITIALMRDVLAIGIQKVAIDDFEHRLFHRSRPA
jgi:hypothetical protein